MCEHATGQSLFRSQHSLPTRTTSLPLRECRCCLVGFETRSLGVDFNVMSLRIHKQKMGETERERQNRCFLVTQTVATVIFRIVIVSQGLRSVTIAVFPASAFLFLVRVCIDERPTVDAPQPSGCSRVLRQFVTLFALELV